MGGNRQLSDILRGTTDADMAARAEHPVQRARSRAEHSIAATIMGAFARDLRRWPDASLRTSLLGTVSAGAVYVRSLHGARGSHVGS